MKAIINFFVKLWRRLFGKPALIVHKHEDVVIKNHLPVMNANNNYQAMMSMRIKRRRKANKIARRSRQVNYIF